MSKDKTTEQPVPAEELQRMQKEADEKIIVKSDWEDNIFHERLGIRKGYVIGAISEYARKLAETKTPLPPSPVGETVAFAEWIGKKKLISSGDGFWYEQPEYVHEGQYGICVATNTKELYNIFAADRPNPSRAAQTYSREEVKQIAKDCTRLWCGLPSEFDKYFDESYPAKTERAGEISPALGPDLAKTIQWMKKAGIKNGENCETSLLESYYEGYVAALDELYKEMECPTPAPEVKEERKCDNCQKPEGDQALVEHDEDKWCLDCMRISGYCVSCDCKIKEKVEDYFDYDSDLCPDCENAPPEPVKDTPVEHVGFYCHDKDHGVSEEKCISQCEDCGGEQRVPDPKGEIPEDIKSWMIEWSREEYEIVYDDDAHAMQIEKWRLIVRGAMKAMYRKMQERVDAAKALMGKAYDDKHALRGQIATLTQQNESLIASAEGWEGKYHRAEGDLQKLIDDLAAKGEEAGEYREAMEKVKSDPNKHPAVRLFIDSVLAKYPSTDAKPTT